MPVTDPTILNRGQVNIDLSKIVYWFPWVGGSLRLKMRSSAVEYYEIDAGSVEAFENAMQAYFDAGATGASLQFNLATNSQYIALLFEDF